MVKATSFSLIFLFMITGCFFNNEEPPARNVRILTGNMAMTYPNILIESVEPDVFRFIRFGWAPPRREYNLPEFDSTLIDDFITAMPLIEWVLHIVVVDADRRPIPLVVTGEWTVELSSEESSYVRRLIENVVRGGEDREFQIPSVMGHVPFVWAIIDDNMYWSFYDTDVPNLERWLRQKYVNMDLLYLSYEIFDLSPYLIHGTPVRHFHH